MNYLVKTSSLRFVTAAIFLFGQPVLGQSTSTQLAFEVSMPTPANHVYHVTLNYPSNQETVTFKMPVWTPGYYQLMNYAQQLENFQVTDEKGQSLPWKQLNGNTWQINAGTNKRLNVAYNVKATRNFVASNYLDETKGYISPAGLFIYPVNQLQQPSTVTVHPYGGWKPIIATGLDSIPGQAHTFFAPNFDILYDSPILMGNLEQLSRFTVSGIPHEFVGYNMGQFDRDQFITDLKKIVEAGASIIGDIPYKHYTFLAIGPGGGGIEHLNSTSISFDGNGLNTPQGRLRLYLFLAHEYFHHFNVKRIRPVALGPFDYDRENRTHMLWVSEGFTVYYEYLMLHRAGLMSDQELLSALQRNISAFENKPGHLFQSVTQASYETWSDGPFGRTGDSAYKTISYYEKGPVLGLLLDFAIRNATDNKKSLDDVMRSLYKVYYQEKNRGFTDEEFRTVCETTAGGSLDEVFRYASTVQPIDYPKYLSYAGFSIDTTLRDIPGGWIGLNLRPRSDSLLVTSVDWDSPAWKAGVRSGVVLLTINGQVATITNLKSLEREESVRLQFVKDGHTEEKMVKVGTKHERSFQIKLLPNPDQRQQVIRDHWLEKK